MSLLNQRQLAMIQVNCFVRNAFFFFCLSKTAVHHCRRTEEGTAAGPSWILHPTHAGVPRARRRPRARTLGLHVVLDRSLRRVGPLNRCRFGVTQKISTCPCIESIFLSFFPPSTFNANGRYLFSSLDGSGCCGTDFAQSRKKRQVTWG